MQGWISLHRKLLEWEWYTDANAMRLFIHLLLKSNNAPAKWRGIDINRGQHLTSIDTLSRDLGLSFQQIRTAIKKLKSTGEITSKTTSKNSIISVTKYNYYQDNNKQVNTHITIEQHEDNKQLTTNNNDNNNNNENNKEKGSKIPVYPGHTLFDEFWKSYPKKQGKSQAEKSWLKLRPDQTLFDLIINTVDRFKTSNEWTKDGGQFIPNASTWINQKRWEDELTYGGHSNDRDRFKPNKKETPEQRLSRLSREMAAKRNANSDNGTLLDTDGSVISTQVGSYSRGSH